MDILGSMIRNTFADKEYQIYPKSVHKVKGKKVFLFEDEGKDYLMTTAPDLGFKGEIMDAGHELWLKAELTHENAQVLRQLFPFTAPSRVLDQKITMGVGDRLGIATPGHIRVFEKYKNVYPVFAQQSIRELNLTNRTFDDVLDCVTYAVFKYDFDRPWGADGDHLKTDEEVEYALSKGYTMLTLDCSEHIANGIDQMTDEEVSAKCTLDEDIKERYLDQTFDIGNGVCISFDESSLKRAVLIYGDAIEHASRIYHKYVDNGERKVCDFELSIDETATPTDPAHHFFVANELVRRGVKCSTIAPRFCGEFQKGIDYVGDLDQFCEEMKIHSQIARYFDYKISIHSGSDKFSIFTPSGELNQGRFHIKTAGTNWLEAMLLVAQKDPSLYRSVHKYALSVFEEARKYYHVTTDLNKIPDVDTLSDEELPDLFKNNDARQLIHITYGLILNAKNADGSFTYKDRLYALWKKYAQEYSELLYGHIGHHLELLLKNCD